VLKFVKILFSIEMLYGTERAAVEFAFKFESNAIGIFTREFTS